MLLFKEEIMMHSSYYKRVFNKGFKMGFASGKLEVVLDRLSSRYPGLESAPQLKDFASRGVAAVNVLSRSLKAADTREAARNAIRAAARS